MVKQLIEKYQVAVLPGTTFGMEEGCDLRISYGALAADRVKEGIGRLVEGLTALV
jgi:aspartate/methionine/tyrosine aminotransferase